jgi:membrane peptidoglycan carboxypeptidase
MADAGGDVIRTTFDRAAMTGAVRAVRSTLYGRLNVKDHQQAAVDKGVQVGLATVDARNGELLAFYPGRSAYNNATQAQIEPGSQMEVFANATHVPQSQPVARPLSLWALMGRVGLTQNLKANPAELPESLLKLRRDPQLALGIAPESPARMAAAFAVFPDNGAYHDLATVLSITVNGRSVWSYTPHATQALSHFAAATLSSKELAGGLPGTIGGDRSAWFTGYIGDIVTSVGLWDESVNARHQVVLRSLDGLGGLPAAESVQWPLAVWVQYTKTATPGEILAGSPVSFGYQPAGSG